MDWIAAQHSGASQPGVFRNSGIAFAHLYDEVQMNGDIDQLARYSKVQKEIGECRDPPSLLLRLGRDRRVLGQRETQQRSFGMILMCRTQALQMPL